LGTATVVVQAAVKSGTLITARLARELGRPVFAIPGEVGRPSFAGSNALIASGEGRALTSPSALGTVTGLSGLSGIAFPTRGDRGGSETIGQEPDPVAAMHPAVRYLRGAGPQSAATLVAQFGADWLGVALQLELEGVIRRDAEGRYLA
jgi:DNA processing protein